MTGAPTVTRLRSRGRRVEVWLDGSAWRAFDPAVVARAGLSVGVVLTRSRAADLVRARRALAALDTAARALAARDHSEASLRRRLSDRGARPRDIDGAVGVLARAGLLDDERAAAERARALAVRGYGDEAIRADLAARGFGVPAIEAALSLLEPEIARVAGLVERHGASAKTLGMLGRRGFAAEPLADLADRIAGEA